MKSRRDFFNYLMLALTAMAAAFTATACGRKPDTVTEPSPEWPPKDQ